MSTFTANSESAMIALGQQISSHLCAGEVVFLYGELGAGKTTLVRGILKSMGHNGVVVSPTYTLVEPYALDFYVYHFDLYRMQHAAELEMTGFREMINADSLCLFEWPERGAGVLPEPDWRINVDYEESQRRVELQKL